MTLNLSYKISNNSISTQWRNKINVNLFYYFLVSRMSYNFITTQLINKRVNNKII